VDYYVEPFTPAERAVLSRFFTNLDLPVFGLINLPEAVKGALFARYSRSPKSLRRLFLDEFFAVPETGIESLAAQMGGEDPLVNLKRAEDLYQRVFFEYGDDSVAQLGGVHLACEQASNLLTKVLERGRLAAYLEQSTRYIAYDTRLGERYRYVVPPEIEGWALATDYRELMEGLFSTYGRLAAHMQGVYSQRHPRLPEDSKTVWNATIRAKAFDTVRGLLPAATISNVGIYATGQAYEMGLMRMRAHPLAEVRDYGDMMLSELRKVIPTFLTRVDRADRGLAWSAYLADLERRLAQAAADLRSEPERGPRVLLTDWDPDAEVKVAAAALYPVSELSDAQLLEATRKMSETELAGVIAAAVGERGNRRHKPGRGMERTAYRFDVICDFGAFRDLQRHRLMTIEWQRLTPRLGYDIPPDLDDEGLGPEWVAAMEDAASLYEKAREGLGPDVAQYVVPLAYQIRFVMEMNARQAFHLIELRTQKAGHPSYRAVCQEMHRQIREIAGHRLIADAMGFVDYESADLERLEGERRAETRRLGA
jgi:thymidylate synthase ThyX